MSSLTSADRQYFERLFGMGSGYVLNFTDRTFHEFVLEVTNLDISSSVYADLGTSKAKRLRSFWKVEKDLTVSALLEELLRYEFAHSDAKDSEQKESLRKECWAIVARLKGESPPSSVDEKKLLTEDFSNVRLETLQLEGMVIEVLQFRLNEAEACYRAKAYLAVVILCGSILEGMLLGCAQANVVQFNQSSCAPKRDGTVLKIPEWKLSNLIDVSTDLGKLSPDVKQFGHALRNFRNYVHPYEQMRSSFSPDEHTAKMSLQVLLAAIADLGGTRNKSVSAI